MTTDKLHANTPATQLDWAGNPIREGGAYNGRPEHFGASERMAKARAAKQAPSPSQIQRMRDSMANARRIRSERARLRKLAKTQAREASN